MPRVEISPDLEYVLRVLKDAETYPAEGHTQASREMLISGLPHALAQTAGEEAHEFQKGMVRLAEAMLAAARGAAVQIHDDLSKEVCATEERFSVAQVAANGAAEVVAGKVAEREARLATLQEVQAEVASADRYFRGAEEAKEALVKQRAELQGQKEAADLAALAMEKLRTEDGEEQDVAQIMNFLRGVGAEEALLAAAPLALAAGPSARSWFDDAAFEELGRVLGRATAANAAALEQGVEGEAEAEAEALGAWAILDVAREREVDATYQLDLAKKAVKAMEAAQEGSKAGVEACRAAMSPFLCQQTLIEEKIKELDAAAAALGRCCARMAAAAEKAEAEDLSQASAEAHRGGSRCRWAEGRLSSPLPGR